MREEGSTRRISSEYRLDTIRKEMLRKAIHLLIALTPALAQYNKEWTILLLCGGLFFYSLSEALRQIGVQIPIISEITSKASRERDYDRFVLGPVTLALGALLSLLLFDDKVATFAIYSLAFGDGLSSLTGRFFGVVKIPFLKGKSVIGSSTCFISIFISGILLFPTASIGVLLAITLAVTIVEALPLKDLDNVFIPLAAGFLGMLFLI